MAFFFIGQEDLDFTFLGTCTVDTATTAARDTTKCRCSLKVDPSLGVITDGWVGTLSSAQSEFWFTGTYYIGNYSGSNFAGEEVVFMDGVVRRLIISPNTSGGLMILRKRNAVGTNTTLQSASVGPGYGTTRQRIDIFVNYAASGQVIVYLNGTVIINYTGDVTTDSATDLDGFVIGAIPVQVTAGWVSRPTWWTSIICADTDTRSLSLTTLPPLADGNTFDWSGSFADVDEVTMNDGDSCESTTADEVMQTTITDTGVPSTPVIMAVAISARVLKGVSGPTQVQTSLRTGGADFFSASQALATSFGRVSVVTEENPDTTAPWTAADLTDAGFNIGLKSIT